MLSMLVRRRLRRSTGANVEVNEDTTGIKQRVYEPAGNPEQEGNLR